MGRCPKCRFPSPRSTGSPSSPESGHQMINSGWARRSLSTEFAMLSRRCRIRLRSTPHGLRPIPKHAPTPCHCRGAGLERLGSDPGVPGVAPSHAGRPGPGHRRGQRFDRCHGGPPQALLLGRGRDQRVQPGPGGGLQPGSGTGRARPDRVPAQRHDPDRALARHTPGTVRGPGGRCRRPAVELLLGASGRRGGVVPRR